MQEPPVEAVRLAADQAGKLARTALMVVVAGAASTLAVAFALGLLVPRLGILVGSGGLAVSAIYGISWRRASAARKCTRIGPYRRVRAEGWCRPPDGCNYALFFYDDGDLPDAVLRLPLRRDVEESVEAWMAGSGAPSPLGGAALFNEAELLATGRILDLETGRTRWQRRHVEPGPMVQRPPKDWMPPGGS